MPATQHNRVVLATITPVAVTGSTLGTLSLTGGSPAPGVLTCVVLGRREGVTAVRRIRTLEGPEAAGLGQSVGALCVGTQQHPEDLKVYDSPGQGGGDGRSGSEVATANINVTRVFLEPQRG